jgi:choline dehydrogenase-like flavoprotein
VRLKSSDPNDFPAVDLGYMTSEADYKISRSALRLAMRLAKTLEQSGYDIKPFIAPDSFEDEDLDNFVKRQGRTFFHYSSSCRMAPEDQYPGPGVVDNELRVHGVQGLRIADSSILPRATTAHPMAPVVMVAEKCASMILLQDS